MSPSENVTGRQVGRVEDRGDLMSAPWFSSFRAFHDQMEGFEGPIKLDAARGVPGGMDRMEQRLLIQIEDSRYAAGLTGLKSRKRKRRPRPVPPRVTSRDWYRPTEILASISAEKYLAVLAPDSEPSRGRCRCPLPDHEDTNPSASYRDTSWYCHRCGEGGGIFQVGAALTGLPTRGPGFRLLKQWLTDRFPEVGA